MHFPIIELSLEPIKKDERMSECGLIDDTALNYFSDYISDTYKERERKEFISGERFEAFLKGIATVNKKKGTITFLDADTIRTTEEQYAREKCCEFLKKMGAHVVVSPNDLAYAGEYFRNDEMMFYYDSCCHTSGNFVSDAAWWEGKTMYIGAILIAHI